MMGIKTFYRGQNIFITGGTGFMGKVLIEKLLRSCPDIKNIYVLIRHRKGYDITTRVNDMLNLPV
jgi:fatty acyl-CoA reductase